MSKYLTWELLLKLFSLAVGLAVTLTLMEPEFNDHNGQLKVALGLLSTVVTTMFIEFIRLGKKFDDLQKRLEQVFAALAERFSSDAQLGTLLRAPQLELSRQQVWFLDGRRQIASGKLLYGEEQFQPYQHFFDSLYREAKPFKP